LYDQAREAGVNIVKFDRRISIAPAETNDGSAVPLRVACTDSVLARPVEIECDLVGISPTGLDCSADAHLAAVSGVLADEAGQLQVNNIHLFPVDTNRPGVFAVGAARGQWYASQQLTDARAAALEAHRILSAGSFEIELSLAVVDPDQCALCLTCIRVCPYGAMGIDPEEGVARCSPALCQRCGICAGECPAKAIELPAYSDAVIESQL
jgi:heterodisulfide reductase subunit A